MNHTMFNTKDSIEKILRSGGLLGLEMLVSERRGYAARSTPLDAFCVLGKWFIDEIGNCGRMDDSTVELLDGCPAVMTVEELRLFMRYESFSWSVGWPFPPSYSSCPMCGGGWSLENAHDFYHNSDSTEYVLEHLVGTPLRAVTSVPELENKILHRVQHDIVYSEVYAGESHCGANQKKWHHVGPDYVIESGDRAAVDTDHFWHRRCRRQWVVQESRVHMRECFERAGYRDAQLVSITNGYDSASYTPWYTAQVNDLPPLRIGWRKRVIHIDWLESKLNLEHLFSSEDVTRSGGFIHAWGYDKAAEYLTKIITALESHRSHPA